MWTDESDLDLGIRVLDLLNQPDVARKPWSAGLEDQELVVPGYFDGLFGGDVVRRGIEQSGPLQHSSRISQPNRVPVGFDFAGCGPARAGAPIKVLKRRRIQEQSF